MVGRPTKITPRLLEKLENAFLKGLSDEEACLLAEIDPKTLYNYCSKNPSFSSKKEQLKLKPKILAKIVIYKELKEGKINTAKWYLERKAKDEFSTKQEIDNQAEIDQNKALNEISESMKAIIEHRDIQSST